MIRQPPAAVPAAIARRKNFHPERDSAKCRRFQKREPGRKVIKMPRFRAGKKGEGDNAHGFLGVVSPMAVRHPCCAENLQLSEYRMNQVRGEPVAAQRTGETLPAAEKKTGDGRGDHRHNHFWPNPACHFNTDHFP